MCFRFSFDLKSSNSLSRIQTNFPHLHDVTLLCGCQGDLRLSSEGSRRHGSRWIHCVHPVLKHSSNSSIFCSYLAFVLIDIKAGCYTHMVDMNLFSLVPFHLKKSYQQRETNVGTNLLCRAACGSKCWTHAVWSNKFYKFMQWECFRDYIVLVSSSWTVWKRSVKLVSLRKKFHQQFRPLFCSFLLLFSLLNFDDRRGKSVCFNIKKREFINKPISNMIEKLSKVM